MKDKRQSRLDKKIATWNKKLSAYLARRPHRSFRRTYRRDYTRSFKAPGYIRLSVETFKTLFTNWRLFGTFFIVYTIASFLILGLIDQANYASLVEAYKGDGSNFFLQTAAIFSTALTGGLSPVSTQNGQVTSVVLVLIAWLTMVWLLRRVTNGTMVKFREGLYNGGAPILPTAIVVFVGLIQCLPIAIAAVGYAAAQSTGVLADGVEAMLVIAAALLLALLSLYWLTSTFIALVVVTLPGMYPMAALRASGDLVVGRRLRLILRLLWLAVMILVLWAVILIPIILLDDWINLDWLPLVPVVVLLLTTLTIQLASTYIYVLYRKLVEDEAKPA